METTQAYQEQSQQAVDAKVINSGVSKEREDIVRYITRYNQGWIQS